MDNYTCRICMEEEKNLNTLISPCLCRGSQKYVHRDCLDQWRDQDMNNSYYRCTTCFYQYKISRIWWGDLLSNKYTIMSLSLVGFSLGGLTLGYSSASLYNSIYYWMHYMKYMSPHRMQTLFHAVMWLGIPGTIIGLYKLITNDVVIQAVREMPENRGNARSAPYVPITHYHYDTKENKDNTPPETKDNTRETGGTEIKEETKVAPHESKSTSLWLVLIAGTVCSFYFTYKWVAKKCRTLCASVKGRIENVEEM